MSIESDMAEEIAYLRRQLAIAEADFEARSKDYHDTISRLSAERNIAWARLKALESASTPNTAR